MTTPAPLMAEELMIGNYLYDTNEDIIQVGINDFQRFRYPSMDGNPSKFKPIPLTEQWLKEFRFIEDSTVTWNKQITLLFHDNHTFKFYYGEDCVYIKYVHQLQNLYHALTATKLERGGV